MLIVISEYEFIIIFQLIIFQNFKKEVWQLMALRPLNKSVDIHRVTMT